MAETKVFTMRLDADLLARIDRVVEGVAGQGPRPSRSEMIRWLLEGALRIQESESRRPATRRAARRARAGR